MKTLMLALLIFLILPYQTRADEIGASFNLGMNIWSEYFDYNGAEAYEEPVLMTDFSFSLPKFLFIPEGGYLGSTLIVGLDDADLRSSYGDEYDFYFGHSKFLFEKTPIEFWYDVGFLYIIISDFEIEPSQNNDLINLYLEFNKDVTIAKKYDFTPYIRFDFIVPVHDQSFDGGTIFQWGLKENEELFTNLNLDHKFNFAYDSGIYDLESSFFVQYELSLSYNLTESFSFQLINLKAAMPLQDLEDSRDGGNFVIGCGFSDTFDF